jgi:hypothetical protein
MPGRRHNCSGMMPHPGADGQGASCRGLPELEDGSLRDPVHIRHQRAACLAREANPPDSNAAIEARISRLTVASLCSQPQPPEPASPDDRETVIHRPLGDHQAWYSRAEAYWDSLIFCMESWAKGTVSSTLTSTLPDSSLALSADSVFAGRSSATMFVKKLGMLPAGSARPSS